MWELVQYLIMVITSQPVLFEKRNERSNNAERFENLQLFGVLHKTSPVFSLNFYEDISSGALYLELIGREMLIVDRYRWTIIK